MKPTPTPPSNEVADGNRYEIRVASQIIVNNSTCFTPEEVAVAHQALEKQ